MTICKRCKNTGWDPDIDMPGTCEHTGERPKRSKYLFFASHPYWMLPQLRKATLRWYYGRTGGTRTGRFGSKHMETM